MRKCVCSGILGVKVGLLIVGGMRTKALVSDNLEVFEKEDNMHTV